MFITPLPLPSIDVQGRLEHAISYEQIQGWKSMDDVECYIDVDMGDYVVYDDWVGQVGRSSVISLKLILITCRSLRYASYITSQSVLDVQHKMFDEAVVEMGSGTLVRLPELSARLAVGERGPVSHFTQHVGED